MSDGELVRHALAGCNEAYGELALRWGKQIFACCHARAHASAAEDLTQEVLLRGFRSLSTLSDPDRFGAWLRGIAIKVCTDWVRAHRVRPVSFSVLQADSETEISVTNRIVNNADESLAKEEELVQLMAEVENLPELYRETLLLYYYTDQTYQELADQLEVSSATINARLTKARALLRERLATKPR